MKFETWVDLENKQLDKYIKNLSEISFALKETDLKSFDEMKNDLGKTLKDLS